MCDFKDHPLTWRLRLGVLVPGRESALASWPSMSRHSLLHFLSDVLMFDVFFFEIVKTRGLLTVSIAVGLIWFDHVESILTAMKFLCL